MSTGVASETVHNVVGMNGQTSDGGNIGGGGDGGAVVVSSRSSPSSDRERRLKLRMAELADKNRDDSLVGGGTTAVPNASLRATSSTAAPRYAGSSLDKTGSSYSSYRYLSSSRHKLYEGSSTLSSNGPSSLDSSPTSTTATGLTSKRDLFFRDGPTVTSQLNSTINGTSHMPRDQDDPVKLSGRDKEKSQGSSKDVEGYVGFANLPNQVYRKAVKKGFEFTLMVVGESGLGKSTLINSMFLSDIYSNEYPGPSHRTKKTVQVETTKVVLKENGVNLQLTVVDTPGFGDAVDNSNCWQPVMDYIENQYEEFLNSESRVNRRTMPDNRVHCCLYFIAPSGHGLKPLDVEFMKRLQDKVNIIPLIAKADTMTPEECALFKKTVMNEIAQNKIKIYEFPDCDDEDENKSQKPLKDRVPFAVVGSNVMVESNGKKLRGRRYPWGVAEVENLEHCDFIALRNMLIRTHMQDLKEITNNVHYENYRCRRLGGVGNDGKPLRVSNKNPLAQMEEEKRDHENKMKKMEQDMEQVFEMKVKEKKQKLKDSEADLQRRHEQMKKNLEQQQKELEEKKKVFEKEKTTWEETNKVNLDDLRRRSLESNSKEQVDGKEKKKEKKKGLF